jgi:ribosomal protein S18 acetylase RimI-like enzyme
MIIHPRGLASSPYLKSIVVDEGYRDRGIGRELLKQGEDYFRAVSKHFFLCVSSFNTRARALYEKLGYKKVGEFSDYIIEGQSEILLYKRLR